MYLFEVPEKSPYVFLLFLVALVSLASIGSSFLFIDDLSLIVNNPKLVFSLNEIAAVFSKPLGQIYDAADYQTKFIYYRPALNLLYMFNNGLWGINPVGFHITNLFLHLLTSILIYRSGLVLFNSDKTFSLLGASLFCVHPAHNELIGRVAMNENLLGLFIALSLYYYLLEKKYLSLLFLAIALLSKESAVMLPFALCLFEMRSMSFRKAVLSLKPYIVLVICYLVVRTLVVGITDGAMINPDGLLIFCSATVDYLRLLLVPYPLNIYYPVLNSAAFLKQDYLAIISSCFLLLLVAWRLRSDKVLFPLLAGTFIMLAPVVYKTNELVIGLDRAYIAERQLYVPSIFFSLFIAGMLFRYAGPLSRKIAVPSLYAVVFVFSYTTARASTVWAKDETVNSRFSHDFPENLHSHKYRGQTLLDRGDRDGALAELKAALPSRKSSGPEHNSLRNTIGKGSNGLDAMLQHYDIAAYQSEYAEVHFLIGEVYLAKGDVSKAMTKYRTALILAPKSISWRARLAEVYRKNGLSREAQREFRLVMNDINQKR